VFTSIIFDEVTATIFQGDGERQATLASILRKSRHGVRLNEHLKHDCGRRCFSTPARWAWKESSRSASARATDQDVRGGAAYPGAPSGLNINL
jgi:hypothetical protein